MKSRIFLLLVLVLIISMSLTTAGCNPPCLGPGPGIIGLQTSSKVVDVGSIVTISAIVTNPNHYNGSRNVTCFVNGSLIGSKTVKLAAQTNQTVTFNYTPTEEGTFNVKIPLNPLIPSQQLSTSFGAVNPPAGCLNGTCWDRGYWLVKYNLGNGSKVTFKDFLLQPTGAHIELPLQKGDGMVTLLVSKTARNGNREVILSSAGWQFEPIFVSNLSPDVNMILSFSLKENAQGTLYIQDGIGDADVSSVSSPNSSPIQINIYGDGKKDKAGSLLVDAILEGNATISGVNSIISPLRLTFTTGNSTNAISMPTAERLDGSTLSSNGVCFAKDGNVAPYVGTNGTITATGTGYYPESKFKSPIHLQIGLKLILELESIE